MAKKMCGVKNSMAVVPFYGPKHVAERRTHASISALKSLVPVSR
jgi:hypothetical protein